MRIKKAKTQKAFQDIEELQKTCLPHDRPCDTTIGHWWVVYEGSRPVGFAGLNPSQQWHDTGYLCRAGVIPEYRGRGLQKRLIRVRCNYAKRLGWGWVITDTTDNPASSNSLIACGFKMYIPKNPWAFSRSNYWIKILCP